MNRLALFMDARRKAQALHLKYPLLKTIESIIHQLDYLIELASGRSTDRSRLKDIILGVQAAREIEPLDLDLADTLYLVNEQVQQM
jgi:hypothetical protein